MKKSLLILFIVSAAALHAQTSSPDVIASGGGFAIGSNFTNSFTIGQGSPVQTLSASSFMLTQGFQQPADMGLGLAPVNEISSLELFPNPSNGEIYLEYDLTQNSDVTIEVFDMLGQRVYTETVSQGTGHQKQLIDLDNQQPGIYFVKCTIKNADGISSTTSKVTITK